MLKSESVLAMSSQEFKGSIFDPAVAGPQILEDLGPNGVLIANQSEVTTGHDWYHGGKAQSAIWGSQSASGVTRSTCRRVSFDDLIRHSSLTFSYDSS